MNLRCTYCQTPFSVGRMEKLAALQHMQAENLHHYDAFCPRCRRANSVSRERLEMFTPGWQEGLKTLEAEAAQAETAAPAPPVVDTTPAAAPVSAPHAETHKKRHAPKAAVVVPPPAPKPVVAKPAAGKAVTVKAKPVTAKPTPVKAKPVTAKPAPVKATPAPSKAKKPVAAKAKPAAKARKPAVSKK